MAELILSFVFLIWSISGIITFAVAVFESKQWEKNHTDSEPSHTNYFAGLTSAMFFGPIGLFFLLIDKIDCIESKK
ncbi:MAG: hypothetical protein R2941_22050 [Desulfobacterales bacterium]